MLQKPDDLSLDSQNPHKKQDIIAQSHHAYRNLEVEAGSSLEALSPDSLAYPAGKRLCLRQGGKVRASTRRLFSHFPTWVDCPGDTGAAWERRNPCLLITGM